MKKLFPLFTKGALPLHLSTVYFSHLSYIQDQHKKCIHISKPLTVISSCCQWNKQIIILRFVKNCFSNFLKFVITFQIVIKIFLKILQIFWQNSKNWFVYFTDSICWLQCSERFRDMYKFSELILNIRKVGKIDSRKMQRQSAL